MISNVIFPPPATAVSSEEALIKSSLPLILMQERGIVNVESANCHVFIKAFVAARPLGFTAAKRCTIDVRLQLFQVIAVDVHELIINNERIRVDALHDAAQEIDLVLGDCGHKNIRFLVRVGAVALPFRHAAVDFLHNGGCDALLFCKDCHLDHDVLRVDAVDSERGDCGINNAVDSRLHIEQQGADKIDHAVDEDVDLADTEIAVALAEIDAENIGAAAGATRVQTEADARAVHEAADDAGGQRILDDKRIRHRDRRDDEGRQQDGHTRLQEKQPADAPVCQQKERDIKDEINDTGNVDLRWYRDVQVFGQHRSGELGNTERAAVVETERGQKQVDCRREQDGAGGHHQKLPEFIPIQFIFHIFLRDLSCGGRSDPAPD